MVPPLIFWNFNMKRLKIQGIWNEMKWKLFWIQGVIVYHGHTVKNCFLKMANFLYIRRKCFIFFGYFFREEKAFQGIFVVWDFCPSPPIFLQWYRWSDKTNGYFCQVSCTAPPSFQQHRTYHKHGQRIHTYVLITEVGREFLNKGRQIVFS